MHPEGFVSLDPCLSTSVISLAVLFLADQKQDFHQSLPDPSLIDHCGKGKFSPKLGLIVLLSCK